MADLLGILRIKDSNGNWVSVPGLKGDTGEPFKILGIYATAAALEAAVTDPGVGDVYLVGTTGAYDIYLYLLDGWNNTGRYMPKGDQGDPAPQSAITSAVETWLAANVDPETGYVLDRTLMQENAAAPADLAGDLKSSIIYATGNEAITISAKDKYLKISNNVIDINNPQTSSSGYGYVIVPCSEGDVFVVSGISANNEPMAWAFTDSTYTIITKASASITVTDEKIVAPANASYLVIHDKAPYRMSYRDVALKDIVKSAEHSVAIISDAIELVSLNLFNPDMSDVINGGYYNQYGVWQNYPGQYCLFIKAKANDKVYRKYPSGYSTFNQTDVAFFNANKEYVTGFKPGDVEFVTVPSNPTIEYITIPVSNTFFTPSGTYEYGVVSYSPITEFHSYGDGAYSRKIANLENSLEEATHWSGKTWFAYGTSITSTSLGKYAQYVAQFSGLILNNKGIAGGALVANRNIYNALNDLTDGKVDADLITIEVGANDWSSPLGDVTTMDVDTFCGALNHSIQTILMNCPKAQVVLMCSTCSRKNDTQTQNMDLDSANTYGVTVEERNEAIRKVAVANGIYFIPLGCGLGLGLFRMQSSDLYNIDQIHHTELGGYNLAKGMWSYLKNIPLWYNAIPS